ncbi:phospholipase A2 inhibitor and Ly6/PLAUR domain-containing protein-like [Toxotes jaculatrix]|uniref:phospholipase A2 inhibitor and Ly6/PLAUR domain-containing protein-like n=1 Tax=Toxotes jaculatrix TaxID=941984 RepID=UPI001B3ACE10|nr:phospholipase A2 inhibitor and Ly6/PLAUR domain-containing protein-like [Toxotes jaculatrix]
MKLIFSLTLIWALSNTAGALQCQMCIDTQCPSTVPVTCPSGTMCITASIQATSSSETPARLIYKACAPSSLCPATGSQTFSVSLGGANAVGSSKCCNTDNCNSETLALPGAQSDNSLQCFTCNPLTSQCNTTLQCKGAENLCFGMSVTIGSTSSLFFGCASANLCTAASNPSSIPILQSVGNIARGPTCCATNLCNTIAATIGSDACCIRLGVIPLLLTLLAFTFY